MALVQLISKFIKKQLNFSLVETANRLKFPNFNPIIFISLIVFLSILFFTVSSLIKTKNQDNKEGLSEITKTSEFSNLTNFFISKLNSPYKEGNYIIKNNDTVEKILKSYNIRNEDIKEISVKLKQKKLSNIYSGRKLSLIYKKLNEKSNTLVNLIYPINNTSSIEIRKSQKSFIVKENILQLYKKEVVVRNVIKNNLYSSAVDAGVESNIIIEFARVFGFEVDFQRDIEKMIGLKYFMKNLKMIIIK